MKITQRHRTGFFGTLMLTAALVCATVPGMAQTPAGTKIRNEARASFLYTNGDSDSIRSNVTETVTLQPLVVASSLSLVASPQGILGNGQDTSWLSATVLDIGGSPVPDGTQVFFTATRGTFPGLADTVTALTWNGVAAVPLQSDIIASGIGRAGVTATTDGMNGAPLIASAEVFFHPGALQGSVESALDSREIPGVVVIVHDTGDSEVGRDTTNSDGIYVIPISKPGVYTRTLQYVTRFGDRMETAAPFVLAAPASGGTAAASLLNAIGGSIIDRSSGKPIREPGIPVTLNRIGQTEGTLGKTSVAAGSTDIRGTFVFDSLAPGTYEIRVDHPQYAGSLIIQDTLSGSFTVEANISASEIAALELVKSANKRIAEPGDGIFYTIEISNKSLTTPITSIRVIDDLPVGFVYASLSSRLDRRAVDEPAGTRTLVWTLQDTLDAGESMRLTYALTIGAGALDGHGINRARGVGVDLAGDTVRSGESSIQVLVHPGVFTDRGIVIGKVFTDLNGNGLQDHNESGIAGVELWMEDGTHIVTGDDGKYSLPEVMPGQHVIRVDQRTLPKTSRLLARGTEFAGDGSARFVRLVEGGIARADFYVSVPLTKRGEKATRLRESMDAVSPKPIGIIIEPPPVRATRPEPVVMRNGTDRSPDAGSSRE
ncbi:MAG TPA: SdrD B-like domain-containing protein [Bacteroidota bacterium]|nr:SdrD B-like domain-containing protein [Bacteroidota bacterium]